MVGVLNIANTFSWGQPYHIGLFGWSNDSINGYIRMTRPRRVGSTWNYQTSDLFVSVVGDIERKDSNGNLTIQTGVCETFTDATFSPWQCGYYWCDNPDMFRTMLQKGRYWLSPQKKILLSQSTITVIRHLPGAPLIYSMHTPQRLKEISNYNKVQHQLFHRHGHFARFNTTA